MVTGRPSMASRISSKSAFWAARELVERRRLLALGVGQDHAAHDRQPVLAEEHVLGAAEADALGAELAGVGGVGAVVGVGPHGELALADLVGPAEDGRQGAVGLRLPSGAAEDDLAGRPVDRDDVALVTTGVADTNRPAAMRMALGAADRRACPSRGRRRRRGSRARPGGEDALGHDHAVDVLGRGLDADEDHLLAPVGGVAASSAVKYTLPTAAPARRPGPW